MGKKGLGINWAEGFNGAITVCDRAGVIVYMNGCSARQFAKRGGEKLIGANLLDCHPEPAKTKLKQMLEKPIENTYTVEKHGKKKIIVQKPWMHNNDFKGVVEISFEIPTNMQNHVKKQ